jgi:hypothetical protein
MLCKKVDESIVSFVPNVMDTMFWYINVLSQNRKSPPLSLTRSRVNNHGGENEDLLLTVTIFNEERRYSMYL